MFQKNFLTFQNKLYIILRLIREEHNPIVETWKEHLRADIVLRRDGVLYFLEEVLDLEIIN